MHLSMTLRSGGQNHLRFPSPITSVFGLPIFAVLGMKSPRVVVGWWAGALVARL